MMKRRKFLVTLLLFIFLLFFLCIISVSFGVKHLSLSTIRDILMGKDGDSIESAILFQRIPRTVFGILAGGSLGVSGVLMQSITRNPIADPGILGVNTGASLFVVIGLSFFQITAAYQYIWLGILGAGFTSLFVYGIASLGKDGLTPLKLALSGSAINIVLSSLVSTIMLPNDRVMVAFRFWQIGSIGGAKWENVILLLPFFLIGFLLSILIASHIENLSLGEEAATSLGTNVVSTITLGSLASILLCGATTALAGPIGFVGLILPHFLRIFFGNEIKKILPLSFLGSAILLLFSDILGRLLGGTGEIEVGIFTSIIGAPIFIFAIRKGGMNS